MRIIALEEHFWTEAIRDAVMSLPPEQRDTSLSVFGTSADAELIDLGDKRLRRMDAAGIDLAVLSVTTPATQSLPPAQAVALAREANDVLVAAIQRHPDRFHGFATLPTPDPAAAAAELERCIRQLGFCGAMVNGRTGERYLDHADFNQIFQVAASLNVPVYIHPQAPPPAVQRTYYDGFEAPVSAILGTAGWGWHAETAIHALRLILAGTFDRLPTLQIILGHWGEMVTFYLERTAVLSNVAKSLRRPVSDYFKTHFHLTPSGMYEASMAQHALTTMGPDRIMFSADDPFVPQAPAAARNFIDRLPLSQIDRAAVAHSNAERLLRLSAN